MPVLDSHLSDSIIIIATGELWQDLLPSAAGACEGIGSRLHAVPVGFVRWQLLIGQGATALVLWLSTRNGRSGGGSCPYLEGTVCSRFLAHFPEDTRRSLCLR